jgi:hypothetical protein
MSDLPHEPPPRQTWTRIAAVATVLAFVLGALPFAVWQVTSQPDEARYTVAAARMMASGDYIIPYTPPGARCGSSSRRSSTTRWWRASRSSGSRSSR